MHKWSIDSDYIFLSFGYCYECDVTAIREWFNSIQHIKELSNADSFRVQVDDVGHGGFYPRVVLWWD